MVGKSLLINTTDRLKRVSVTDPEIADAIVVTATQVLIHGRAPGEVSLLIWDEFERSRSFDLRVDVDITACRRRDEADLSQTRRSKSPPRARPSCSSGYVTTEDVAKHAGLVAAAYSKNVINVLNFGPVGAQEVMLEVKFAEVDRSAVTAIGSEHIRSRAREHDRRLTQTGQFGQR